MNIIEVEDKLKSIPDDNLFGEMTNPSGMFPQYLVMSEITRRKEMRDDYEGRMAANAKTPPRPSMREEMAMEVAQIQPQPNEMQQGIGSLLQPQPTAQPQQPMMSNQPVMMQNVGEVPNVFEGIDPQTKGLIDYINFGTDKDREESKWERKLREYYESMQTLMPKKIEEEKKFLGGLNLVRAGLAVGTSATPKDLNKNLSSTIDSITETNKHIDEKESDMHKLQLEQATLQAAQEGRDKEHRASVVGILQTGDRDLALKNYYEGLIDAAKDKSEFERLSKTEQEIVGILNLVKLDKAKTLPIYFTEEDAMADPSGNTVAGEIDYYKLNNLASQRVAASSIYGQSIRQQTQFETDLKPSMIDEMIWRKEWEKINPGKSIAERDAVWNALNDEERKRASAKAREQAGLL